jgi:molybdenum cofactor biosynthesis protein B
MGVNEHREHAKRGVACAVLTVSDTRTRRTDETGAVIRQALEKEGHEVLRQGIVKDARTQIAAWLRGALRDNKLQVIILNGGTGITARDVTVEAVRPLLEKEIVGFGELFRMLSYRKVGSAAMMSRALAGTACGKTIFCLPGSPAAARLAMDRLILPELGHLVWEMGR